MPIFVQPSLALLDLGSLPEALRRSERDLWQQFELARPSILGALLDLIAHGLRTLPGIAIDRMPRMADFALWAAACETACWPPGTFSRAYEANRRAAIESMVDADPVAACVRQMMTQRSSWTGTADELLRAGAGRTVRHFQRQLRLAQKSPRARGPPASRAVFSSGESTDSGSPRATCRAHRQHGQHRLRPRWPRSCPICEEAR